MAHNLAIERAIERAHGLTKLAKGIGVSPPTVHEWKTGERQVPPKRCVAIEQFLSGAISRREFRPDDWREFWPDDATAQADPAPEAIEPIAAESWDGVERRHLAGQHIDPAEGRREIDRPDGFPAIAGV